FAFGPVMVCALCALSPFLTGEWRERYTPRNMSDPRFARLGRQYQAGEVLFREGESGDVMFVIQSGAVRITKEIGGDSKVLAVFGAGAVLWALAILTRQPRNATATVIEPTRCLLIESKTLESMVSRNA